MSKIFINFIKFPNKIGILLLIILIILSIIIYFDTEKNLLT